MKIMGLDQLDNSFIYAILSKTKNSLVIHDLREDKLEVLADQSVTVATGISGRSSIVRNTTIPLTKKSAIRQTLNYQLAQIIPGDLSKMVIRPIFSHYKAHTNIIAFIAPIQMVQEHLSKIQSFKIDPGFVSAHSMALYRFSMHVAPQVKNIITFHLSDNDIQILLIKDGLICKFVNIETGTQDICGDNSSELVLKLKKEIERAVLYLRKAMPNDDKIQSLFCGRSLKVIEDAQPFAPIKIQSIDGFNASLIAKYAIPIGLAIDALDTKKGVQFRQGKLASKKIFSMLYKQLYICLFSSFLIVLGSLLGNKVVKNRIEKRALEKIEALTQNSLDLPFLNKEVNYITLSDANRALNNAFDDLKAFKITQKMRGVITKALIYISEHPNLSDLNVKRIDYFSGETVNVGIKSNRLAQKVSVTFESKCSKKAREFHDAIIEDSDFIDEKQPIEWSRKNDEYAITFYVNKEVYQG